MSLQIQDYLLESMVLGFVVLAAVKAATILFTVVPGPAGMPYSHDNSNNRMLDATTS